MNMTSRQRHALLHPLSRADLDPRVFDAYRATRKHATGLLLMTLLAVDR